MSTLERIEQLEANLSDCQKKLDDYSLGFNQLLGAYQVAIQKLSVIEQTATSLAKTIAALSIVLVHNKVISGDDVMTQIRISDDHDQEQEVKEFLKGNFLKKEEIIDLSSFVVVRQQIIDTETGSVKLISDYSFFQINHPSIKPELRSLLVGKKINETIEGKTNGSKKELITVKEIYSVVEQSVKGDTPEQVINETETLNTDQLSESTQPLNNEVPISE